MHMDESMYIYIYHIGRYFLYECVYKDAYGAYTVYIYIYREREREND